MNNPSQRSGGSRPQSQTQKEAPTAVKVVYYKDKARKILDPELLDQKAQEQANKFPDVNDKNRKDKLSKSQIRRFFGAIKNLHFQLENGRSWEQVLPLFKMFQSKVAYAKRSGGKKIPEEFAVFLEENIKLVGNDEDNFRAFVLYFEAVLGFAYGNNKIGE
ncbi:MAG TPA: type III-A CRISPR-associated protein Csm2 [Anaerohalosphaeraceae bacterium]|nr:type III-A CRISPR-associated protein Csm2 [Anaerohalosphaeraceae bacterium]